MSLTPSLSSPAQSGDDMIDSALCLRFPKVSKDCFNPLKSIFYPSVSGVFFFFTLIHRVKALGDETCFIFIQLIAINSFQEAARILAEAFWLTGTKKTGSTT